jgi:hypothetical protein
MDRAKNRAGTTMGPREIRASFHLLMSATKRRLLPWSLPNRMRKTAFFVVLFHNADYRIMPAETMMIWFFGPYCGPLSSPLAKATRHNPDILGALDHPERRWPVIKRFCADVSPCRPVAERRRHSDSKGQKPTVDSNRRFSVAGCAPNHALRS